jgi:hypothetical protein
MSEKIYVPKCYAREKNGKYGNFLSVSFNAEALIEFVKQHKTEKGYLNLTISPRKQASEDGVTHSVMLDTYKPQGDRQGFQKAREAVRTVPQRTLSQQEMDASEPPF